MPVLYAFTLFVSALLLFMVQPMIGRMILPLLGGSPAAWNTCMVFFQFVLLLGYLYAHKLTAKLTIKQQFAVHVGVLAIAMGTFALAVLLSERSMPIAVIKSLAPQSTAYPMFGVMALLAVAIGVPFFAVSTSAPLLQRWFAYTGHASAKDPYFLYAASNAGSLLSLLAYPLLIEPNLTLMNQSILFAGGFAGLAVLIFLCGVSTRKSVADVGAPLAADPSQAPTTRRIIKWVLLAFVPSSLMLGVTFYMTTDIASIPLLWVIPLALYLLTFIIAFMRTPAWMRVVLGNIAPVVTLLLIFVMITQQPLPSVFMLLSLHLAAFFLLALMCHSELAHDRPPPAYLTNFFLWISVGGMLGGVFNALLAPLIFPLPWEYSIALVIGCMMVPKLGSEPLALTQRQRELRLIYDIFTPLIMFAVVMGLTLLNDQEWYSSLQNDIAGLISKVLGWFGARGGLDAGRVRDGMTWALPLIACFFFIDRPIRFGCCVAAVVFVGEFSRANMEFHTERSFFGILKVQQIPRDLEKPPLFRKLVHGTTLHGTQAFDEWPLRDELREPLAALCGPAIIYSYDWRAEPLTYYHRSGPVGHLFAVTRIRHPRSKVAMVGLGTGSVACYADKDLDLTFYEIDPTVMKLVSETTPVITRLRQKNEKLHNLTPASAPGQVMENDRFFTYVSDARRRNPNVDIILGDARIKLDENKDARYDLLLVDAFSSDSIPVHLLTKEALELYMQRLTPDGLLALHISNKFVKLDVVVASLAKELGLSAMIFEDSWIDDDDSKYCQYSPSGKTQSSWCVLAKDPQLLEIFAQERFTTQYRYKVTPLKLDPKTFEPVPDVPRINRWTTMKANSKVLPWTDDYADVLMVMMLKEVQKARRMFGQKTLDELTE